MFSAHYGLDNLVAIVDLNGLQIDGPTCEVMDLGSVGDKFAAFGWTVIGCDGHSSAEVLRRAHRAKASRTARSSSSLAR